MESASTKKGEYYMLQIFTHVRLSVTTRAFTDKIYEHTYKATFSDRLKVRTFSGKTGGKDSKETVAQIRAKVKHKLFIGPCTKTVTHKIILHQVMDNFFS